MIQLRVLRVNADIRAKDTTIPEDGRIFFSEIRDLIDIILTQKEILDEKFLVVMVVLMKNKGISKEILDTHKDTFYKLCAESQDFFQDSEIDRIAVVLSKLEVK